MSCQYYDAHHGWVETEMGNVEEVLALLEHEGDLKVTVDEFVYGLRVIKGTISEEEFFLVGPMPFVIL